MYFEIFDRQFFDILIFIVFGTGVIAAVIRIYQDFSRPLPPDEKSVSEQRSTGADEEDTQPHSPEGKAD